jgi:hypothetical protein
MIKVYNPDLIGFSVGGFERTTLLVIDTDCTDSCKTNYHTITIRTMIKFSKLVRHDILYELSTIVYFMLCCYNFLNEFEGKIYGSYYYVNHTSSVTAEA